MNPCPTCGEDIAVVERYPMYICSDCVSVALTKEGESIQFYNEDMGGGCIAYVNNVIVDTNECYVNGELCRAQEARFGGIVVSAVGN